MSSKRIFSSKRNKMMPQKKTWTRALNRRTIEVAAWHAGHSILGQFAWHTRKSGKAPKSSFRDSTPKHIATRCWQQSYQHPAATVSWCPRNTPSYPGYYDVLKSFTANICQRWLEKSPELKRWDGCRCCLELYRRCLIELSSLLGQSSAVCLRVGCEKRRSKAERLIRCTVLLFTSCIHLLGGKLTYRHSKQSSTLCVMFGINHFLYSVLAYMSSVRPSRACSSSHILSICR